MRLHILRWRWQSLKGDRDHDPCEKGAEEGLTVAEAEFIAVEGKRSAIAGTRDRNGTTVDHEGAGRRGLYS